MESISSRYRAWIAVASAISGVVAYYLHWMKMNPPESGDPFAFCAADGGCALVQNSAWGWFLGYDVALIGTVGYAAIFLVSVAGLLPRWVDARGPTFLLMGLIYTAVLFTIRLKYAEFVILKSFCPWCAVSAVTITLCAIFVTLDWRQRRGDDEVDFDDLDDVDDDEDDDNAVPLTPEAPWSAADRPEDR